jgi:hypothetical protein
MTHTNFKKLAQMAVCGAVLSATAASAQTAPYPAPAGGRQALQAELSAHAEATARAAAVLLDRSKSLEERTTAGKRVEAIFRADQVAAAIQLARDSSQHPRLRALALSKVMHAIPGDDALVTDVLKWISSRETPPVLRFTAVEVAEGLMFSSLAAHARRGEFLEAFRSLLRDPESDPELRRRAFALLSAEGDDLAQRLLIEALKSPKGAAVPPAEAVRLLGLRLPADAYPVLAEILRNPPDPATRLEVIRHLGGYPPSRPDLVRILQDPKEAPAARLAALGALHANVPESLPEIVLPIIRDEQAGDELRVQALQNIRWRRTSSKLRLHGIPAFDAAVREISTASRSEAVRRVAREYLDAIGAGRQPYS